MATDAEHDVHVYFWFPLLAGLSELVFDSRMEIRRSSLEVRSTGVAVRVKGWRWGLPLSRSAHLG